MNPSSKNTTTIQLTLRGKASAFDLNPTRDSLCLASPGCLSFYDLNGIGSPRSLIHYEQPQQIRKVVYHHGGRVAALRGGVVSIFDPSSTIFPLKNSIKVTSTWINDVDWSSSYTHLLTVCCENGNVKVFDTRAPTYPVSNLMSTGSSPRVMIKRIPGSGSMLAASSIDMLHIWDTRMNNTCIAEIPSSSGITKFTWDVYSEGCDSTFLICHRDKNLEWYNASTFVLDACVQSPYAINDDTFLLSLSPRVIACCALNSTDPMLSTVFLVGSPRPKTDLGGVFSKSPSLFSPGVVVAQTTDTVVGVCVGEPGRLVPPSQGGTEIVLASTSACIHAIKISSSMLSQLGTGTAAVTGKTKARSGDVMQALHSAYDNKKEKSIGSLRDIRTLYRISPKYSVNLLQDDHVTNLDGRNAVLSKASNMNAKEFWRRLQEDVLILETLIQRDDMGITIDGIDPNARQITLAMKKVHISLDSIHHNQLNYFNDIEFSLVISFPAKYPLAGAPLFTLRPLSYTALKAADLLQFVAEVTVELNNLVRTTEDVMFRESTNDEDIGVVGNLLTKIASCFRDRVVQFRTSGFTAFAFDSGNKSSSTPSDLLSESKEISNLTSNFTSLIDDVNIPIQAHSMVETTVIDPLAYHVPCPRSSGAFFSNEGILLCFGGAQLSFEATQVKMRIQNELQSGNVSLSDSYRPGNHVSTTAALDGCNEHSSFVYPRTYAEVLLKFKEETLIESIASSAMIDEGDEEGEDEMGEYNGKKTLSGISNYFDKLTQGDSREANSLLLLEAALDAANNSTPSSGGHEREKEIERGLTSSFPSRIQCYRLWSCKNALYLASRYSLGPTRQAEVENSYSKKLIFEQLEVAKETAAACRANACIAQSINESSTSRTWVLLSISLGAMCADDSWMTSAIGWPSFVKIFRYLQLIGDIQSLATLVCVLGGCNNAIILFEKCLQRVGDSKGHPLSMMNLNRAVIAYADVLRRWGKLDIATEILKYSKVFPKKRQEVHHELKIQLKCTQCFEDMWLSSEKAANRGKLNIASGISRSAWCINCKDFSLRCSICNLAVFSTGCFCFSCGHGGHSSHIKAWFEQYSECPAGCGCRCSDSTAFDSQKSVYEAVASENQIEFLETSRREPLSKTFISSKDKGRDSDEGSDAGSDGFDDDDDWAMT